MTDYLDLRHRRGRQYLHSVKYRTSNRNFLNPIWARSHRFRKRTVAGGHPVTSSHPTKRTCVGSIIAIFVRPNNQPQQILRSCAACTAGSSTLSCPGSSNSPSPHTRCEEHEDMAAVDMRRGSARPGPMIGGPISGMIHRPSLAENVRTASRDSVMSSQSASGISGALEEKPIASGNGVSLSITLAEPLLFLQGFDQSELGNQTTTMLRGSFHLRVSKSAKIKSISLTFRGRAETEWPEGQYNDQSHFHVRKVIY